ncbi:MAG: chromosomal replication initiator protein DnaA, partial [Spirochaetes bacterium]|nr:chromosomal replication initiator protein DnaA [Spirochaetota bacterium]
EYNTWINQISYITGDEKGITISVPNRLTKEIVAERYQKLINDKIRELVGKPLQVRIEVNSLPAKKKDKKEEGASAKKITGDPRHALFNPKYMFENFVVGSSNDLAAAAAKKIAENPGKYWNPLFLYGGVGLGKTHLLHAIGHIIIDKFPEQKIMYISGESFMNDYITSIQKGTMNSFRIRYRKADLLLIDDVHSIQGKEGTMEELFHTFNTLYAAKKQMVFTSDRPPKELRKLEDRLRSRFEWGLTADIQPPNFEMRESILRQKVAGESYKVPEEVVRFISENFTWNIRELESALYKLFAYHDLVNEKITIDLARRALKDMIRMKSSEDITIDLIQKKVANVYSISFSDMKSKKRAKNIALPRQIAMYIARNLTDFSTTEIGNEFGGKDHSTVIHAVSKIKTKYEEDDQFRQKLDKIVKEINEEY